MTHSLLPWHAEVMHGDNRNTLLPDCTAEIEAEANYGAGRLLFLRDRFAAESRGTAPSIAGVRNLRVTFGNTISSTLWRFVETMGETDPMIGMMTFHPDPSRRPADFNPARPCRHFIQTPAFQARFAQQSERNVFEVIGTYRSSKLGGLLW